MEIARDASGKWILRAPSRADADQAAAEAAATQVGALRSLSTVRLAPAVVGLDKPAYTLTIAFPGGESPTGCWWDPRLRSRTATTPSWTMAPTRWSTKPAWMQLIGLLEGTAVPGHADAEGVAHDCAPLQRRRSEAPTAGSTDCDSLTISAASARRKNSAPESIMPLRNQAGLVAVLQASAGGYCFRPRKRVFWTKP